MGEALSQSAESLSIVSTDLKSFLLSDSDTVPRSLRQAFKIGKCPEFQESVTVLSAALTRGLLRGFKAHSRKQGYAISEVESIKRREQGKVESKNQTVSREDAEYREIREVGFSAKKPDVVSLDVSSNSIPSSTYKKEPGNSQILDVICSDQCRALISHCIQTLVSTAITVYVDKTKDVNFYEDMVAGITNPTHLAPMKDLFTSVCNGAIGTLVRTLHEVMFVKNELSGSDPHNHQQQQQTQKFKVHDYSEEGVGLVCSSTYVSVHNPQVETHCQEIVSDGITVERVSSDSSYSSGSQDLCQQLCLKPQTEVSSLQRIFNTVDNPSRFQSEGSSNAMQSFIDGLSKTLAIPTNRKLVLDLAATMTSEGVKSFVDIAVGTVKNYLHTNISRGSNRLKSGVSEFTNDRGCQLQTKFRSDAATKALLLATICLAICLHVLTGIRMLESA